MEGSIKTRIAALYRALTEDFIIFCVDLVRIRQANLDFLKNFYFFRPFNGTLCNV